MTVPSVLSGINWEGVEEPKTVPAPNAPVAKKEGTVETPTSYVARTMARTAGEDVGRKTEATTGLVFGQSIPKSAINFFFGKEAADKWMPESVEKYVRKIPGATLPFNLGTVVDAASDVTGNKNARSNITNAATQAVHNSPMGEENLGDIATTSMSNARNLVQPTGLKKIFGDDPQKAAVFTNLLGPLSFFMPEYASQPWSMEPSVGAAPGYASKNIGRAGSFLTSAALNPGPAGSGMEGAIKYGMGAIGASEFGELGRILAEAPARIYNKFNPENPVPEDKINTLGTLAEIPSAMFGSMANIVRYNAVKKGLDTATAWATRPYTAYKGAIEAGAQGDVRPFSQRYASQFANLRAESQGTLEGIVKKEMASQLRDNANIYGNNSWVAKAEQLDKDAASVGIPSNFTLAQKTQDPGLVAATTDFRPTTPENVHKMETATKQGQEAVIEGGKRILGRSIGREATRPDMATVADDAQAYLNLRLVGLNTEANNIAATTPTLGAKEKSALGDRAKELLAKEQKAAQDTKNELYADRDNAAMGANGRGTALVNLQPVRQEAESVLGKPLSEINPETAPQSLKKLRDLASADKPIPVTVKDWGELLGQMNGDIGAYEAAVARNPGDIASANASRNLQQVRNKLQAEFESQMQKQGRDDVIDLHNAAVNFYKDSYAPRFKEGPNSRMSKTNNYNEEDIDPMQVFSPNSKGWLEVPTGTGQVSESQMQNFDKAFGGVIPGTKKVPEAYALLGKNLEDQYSTQVMKHGTETFSPNAHQDFMRKYEAAIDRVPGLRDKLNNNAVEILDRQNEAKRLKDQFDTLIKSPLGGINSTTGTAMFDAALSDPRKMGQLIKLYKDIGFEGGTQALVKEAFYRAMPWKEMPDGTIQYDAKKLHDFLDSGKANEAGPSSIQVAFRDAFGRAEGDAHLERLRALARIQERVESTNPKFFRPMEPLGDATLQGNLGTGIPGLTSQLNSLAQGRTGLPFMGSYLASRFGGQKLKAALNDAYVDALFNPKKSEAIYDLASKQVVKEDSVKAITDKMGDVGQKLYQDLLDHGHIKGHLGNAARLDIQMQANENREKNKESQFIQRRPIQ